MHPLKSCFLEEKYIKSDRKLLFSFTLTVFWDVNPCSFETSTNKTENNHLD